MTGPIIPLIDPKCLDLGIEVYLPSETDRLHWELSHIWLTEGGCWDNVPDFAKPFQNDHLGGDRHLYMLGFRVDGSLATEPDLFALLWPGDHHLFSPKIEHEWWGNVPINAGFDWSAGDIGPYDSQMNAISSTLVKGLGLPYPPYPWQTGGAPLTAADLVAWDGETYLGDMPTRGDGDPPITRGGLHTSFFLVFQEVEAYTEPEPPEPPEPPLPSGQLQRCLDSAEKCADWVASSTDGENKIAAADIYTNIASILAHMKGCKCP